MIVKNKAVLFFDILSFDKTLNLFDTVGLYQGSKHQYEYQTETIHIGICKQLFIRKYSVFTIALSR